MPTQPLYRLQACTAQHLGDRDEQQDRLMIMASPRDKRTALVVVADGMGGKTGGALAAQQVITTAKTLFADFNPGTDDPEDFLRQIAQEAHTVIKLTAFSSEKEPHSTAVMLLLQPDRVDWAHVGDSRLYYFRQDKLAYRTVDHSFAEMVARENHQTKVDARLHRLNNVLTSALGSQKDPEITLGASDNPQPGDHYLLCSDGLWSQFSEEEMGKVINHYPPREASEVLINTAYQRAQGHSDNCSLAIIKLVRLEPSS
ncbi:MAG: serine/threonine-protein phosphatase [Burkholderiaceae bacterium]|nr:MAG: serine/threonine-protein phosphatase [Burkholderiaceae bacterium]